MQNSDRSIEIANEALSEYRSEIFSMNGAKEYAYSDDYSGVYIDDDGILNVCIVFGSQKKGQEFDDQVIYREQRFSYNYLKEVEKTVISLMEDSSIFSVGIKQSRNQVDVSLREERDIENIISCLTKKELCKKNARQNGG